MLFTIADLIVEIPEAGGLPPRYRKFLSNETIRADIVIRTESYRMESYRMERYAPGIQLEKIADLEAGRQFASKLLHFNGFYLHASAVEVDGNAYLFSAPSGTGKSTHTRLWKQHFGDRACIFNDDKPALRYVDGTWYAYGTPWCGKDDICANRKVPLAGICFLKQAPNNQIRPLSSKEAIPRLINQTICGFRNQERLILLLNHLEKLIQMIPIFELENRPELEAAQLSYETMYRAAKEKGL